VLALQQLQWLPPTIHPNLLASLGREGRFKLWAEDPSAAPGRRFSSANRGGPKDSTTPSSSNSGAGNAKAAFETRSSRAGGAPFRSFSMRHADDTRHTYLALLAADGRLTVYENETAENLADWTQLDEFSVLSEEEKPARGVETAFRVRFDPGPEPCYTALRAGVPSDALGLVVAAMDKVRVYRTRDTVGMNLGVATAGREFYLAVEIEGHKGLVRDVAWAPGNIRGYDLVATACQDGFVRVFRVETPYEGKHGKESGGRGWAAADVKRHAKDDEKSRRSGTADARAVQHHSGIREGLSRSGGNDERRTGGQHGHIKHTAKEISRMDSHRTPIWRVGFDDDGQILGSVGDEGRLICYRQTPDGSWAKSAEMSMLKVPMAMP
jgi:nucleoporin SEH1